MDVLHLITYLSVHNWFTDVPGWGFGGCSGGARITLRAGPNTLGEAMHFRWSSLLFPDFTHALLDLIVAGSTRGGA